MIKMTMNYLKEHITTVKEMKEILTELEKDGYGNLEVCMGYDTNFAYTSTNGNYKIKNNHNSNDGVYFEGVW